MMNETDILLNSLSGYMNWPGADIIYRRLSLVPSQKIMWAYKYSVSIAEQTHDDIWNLVLSDFYIDNLSETGKK